VFAKTGESQVHLKMKQQVLLVYNDRAGSLKLKYHLEEVRRLIENEGFQVRWANLQQVGGIKSMLGNCRAIVVAGGDGTVNLVAEQLLKEEIKNPPPLAVLPWGTANDLCRQIYRKGSTTADILAAISKETTTRLDVGQVNDRYFLNAAAAGMFSDVAYLTPNLAKRLLVKPAYYLHGLAKLLTYRPFRLTIEADGETLEEEALLFAVLNGSLVGGMFTLVPGAALNDGKLHLLTVKKSLSIAQILKMIYRILRGNAPDQPGIINQTAKNITLQFPADRLLVIDGELGPLPPLQVSLLPRRLPFYSNISGD